MYREYKGRKEKSNNTILAGSCHVCGRENREKVSHYHLLFRSLICIILWFLSKGLLIFWLLVFWCPKGGMCDTISWMLVVISSSATTLQNNFGKGHFRLGMVLEYYVSSQLVVSQTNVCRKFSYFDNLITGTLYVLLFLLILDLCSSGRTHSVISFWLLNAHYLMK